MSGRRPNLLYKSFHHRKKIFYVMFSILLSIGLIISDVYDMAMLLTLQKPDVTTHKAINIIMVRVVLMCKLILTCKYLSCISRAWLG